MLYFSFYTRSRISNYFCLIPRHFRLKASLPFLMCLKVTKILSEGQWRIHSGWVKELEFYCILLIKFSKRCFDTYTCICISCIRSWTVDCKYSEIYLSRSRSIWEVCCWTDPRSDDYPLSRSSSISVLLLKKSNNLTIM